VTSNWLAFHECFNEFRAAWYMGRRIIPLFSSSEAARAVPIGTEPGIILAATPIAPQL